MPTFVSKKQLAEILSCSERKIDDLRANHNLPCFKIDGLIRFNLDVVLKWLEDNSSNTTVPSLQKK